MVPGTQVGVYRLLQKIGEGGMGAVWLAEHTMLGRRAAIKLLHPMFNAQQDIVGRFFNEARAATAISDPGIVQIFDFGHHIDGTAYIAMEMLDGEPLDERLSRLGRLSIGDAMRIMRQVAGTLGVAHARGIIHRDLKPENVYLVHDPEVAGGERAKVLDFGIAKLDQYSLRDKTTKTGSFMGTPYYMSPEQARGKNIDWRSDLWALGVIVFQCLTGKPPFESEALGDLMGMILYDPIPKITERDSSLPPEIETFWARAINRDRELRFQSARDLAFNLETMSAVSSPGTGSSPRRP